MTSRVRVGDVLELQRRAVTVDPAAEYEEIGIRSFGKGIFHKEPVRGVDLGNKRVFRVEPGDLVLSNVFAWEGAVALASASESGMIGSHRFMTFTPRDGRIDPSWAAWFFLSEPGLELIRKASPGSAGRNRTLAVQRFESLEIPLPPVEEQRATARHIESTIQITTKVALRVAASRRIHSSLLDSVRAQGILRLDAPTVPLGSVVLVNMGQSPPGEAYNDVESGLPLLNGPTEFGLDHPHPRTWTDAVTKTAEPGDLLLAVRATIGRVNWADQRYCIGRGLAALRPSDSRVLPSYLRHALLFLGPTMRGRTVGSTFANLSRSELAALPLPLPNLAIQERISASLDRAEDRARLLVTRSDAAAAIAAALRPSLIKHYLGHSTGLPATRPR